MCYIWRSTNTSISTHQHFCPFEVVMLPENHRPFVYWSMDITPSTTFILKISGLTSLEHSFLKARILDFWSSEVHCLSWKYLEPNSFHLLSRYRWCSPFYPYQGTWKASLDHDIFPQTLWQEKGKNSNTSTMLKIFALSLILHYKLLISFLT